MAERKIINQAQIDAAKQAERVRQQQLAAAQTEVSRLQPNVQSAEAIQKIAAATGKISKKTGKPQDITAAEKAAATSTRVGEEILTPYTTAMGQVSSLGVPIEIPAAIYEQKKLVSTYIDSTTGDTIGVYDDGTTQVLTRGNKQEEKRKAGQSAYDLLFEQFNQYGLGGLVEPLKNLVVQGLSPAEFTLKLRETDAYKQRFAANQARLQKGLRVLSEAQYIDLEDRYQDVMRRYGLPESYYTRGDMGRQEGFEKFISGDVSPTELEDRIQVAQRRVINAAPEITNALRAYYPEVGQGEMLAYFLDPTKAIEDIRRKVTAAEIQSAANISGLNVLTPEATKEQIEASRMRAEELARYGVTGETARRGFQTIAEVAPRGGQLAQFYGETPYTQATAEQETFGLAGATEAARQRKKLTQLEQASFAGRTGAATGALARDRAGSF